MFKTFVTATALSGLLALSANALEIGADASAGISFDDGIAVGADVSAGVDANADTDPVKAAKARVEAEGYSGTAESGFVGNTVETSDGQYIGVVSDVYTKPDAETRVRVIVDKATGLEAPKAFWLGLSADADSDGKLVLPMTMAEFQADVEAKMDAQG